MPDYKQKLVAAQRQPKERVSTTSMGALVDGFMLDTWVGQAFQRHEVDQMIHASGLPEENYNAFRDSRVNLDEISPHLFDELTNAESYADVQGILEMSRVNAEREKRLENHGLARFVANMADPLNFIPTPFVMGRGFVKAAAAALPANLAIVSAAEAGRTYYDPNDNMAQTSLNITMGTLLASGIAGAFGMIPYSPRTAGMKVHGYNNTVEHVAATSHGKGPGFKDLEFTQEKFDAAKQELNLPPNVTREDVIRGRADDGLPMDTIRMVALREGDEVFGKRITISKDAKAGDFVMRVNGQETLRGSKADLIKDAQNIGTRRVNNFASTEAIQHLQTKLSDVHPDMPDPKVDPEGYAKYVDDELPMAAEVDGDGVRLPKHSAYFNRHVLRDMMDAERLEWRENINGRESEIDRLRSDLDMAKRKLRHRNQHSPPKEELQGIIDTNTNLLAKLEPQLKRVKELRDDLEYRIDLAEQTNDPLDLMIKPTGLGIEKAYSKLEMFPWFNLTNNKLTDLAPDLAVEWQRIAYRLSGSPGLMYRGGERGVGVGTSAEMQATQWWHPFREAKTKMDSEYAKLYGYGDYIGPSQQLIQETKQDVVKMGQKARIFKRGDLDIDATGEGMSFAEFRAEVSKTMINGGKVSEDQARILDEKTITAIENSASAWRQFFDKFKQDAEVLGVFQTERSASRNLLREQAALKSIDEEIARLTQPFPDLDVEVRRGPYPPGLKDPHPDGRIPAAFRRTIDGQDVIFIDPDLLSGVFEKQSWKTSTTMRDGSKTTPLDIDFKTRDELERFVLAHEKAHVVYRKQAGETVAAYEDRINREAAKEIKRADDPGGRESVYLRARRNDQERQALKVDMAERTLNQMKGLAGDGDWLAPDYFFRIWLPENIKENDVAFKAMLRTYFKQNPYKWVYGKKKKMSTRAQDIEARVDETYNHVIREAQGQDPFSVNDEVIRKRQFEDTIEDLRTELDDLRATTDDPMDTGFRFKEQKILKKIKQYETLLDNPQEMALLLPTPLKSRGLDIDNKTVLKAGNFIELDVEHVAHRYLQKMAPIVEVSRNFGDHRLVKYRDPLNAELAKRVDELRKAGDNAKANAIEKEGERLNKAVDTLRDIVLGTYGMSKDPASWTGRFVRSSMAYMNLVGMGKAAMVALNDFGNFVGYVGWKNAFGHTWRYTLARIRRDASEWNLARDEVLAAGEASNMFSSMRMAELTNIGGLNALGRGERFLQKHQQRMFVFNLLTPWTDFMEGMTGALAQHAIIRDAVAMADGKLSKGRLAELTKLGMTKNMADRISAHWKSLPEDARMGRHLYLANADKLAETDPVAARAFRAMLATEISNLVPSPKAADKPTFMHKDWGRLMFQYKGFSFAATSKILMANAQRRDARTLATALSMIGMSWLIDMKKRPDYINMDLDDSLFRAVEISGVAGIFSDVNQAIEGVSGGDAGLRPMLGLDPRERDVTTRTRFGAIAGPVPNLLTSFGAAFLSEDSDTADRMRAIRYSIPYNNLLYWSDFVDRLQRGSVNALEQ